MVSEAKVRVLLRAGFGKGKDTERELAGTSETVSPCAILPGVKEEKVGLFICDRPS